MPEKRKTLIELIREGTSQADCLRLGFKKSSVQSTKARMLAYGVVPEGNGAGAEVAGEVARLEAEARTEELRRRIRLARLPSEGELGLAGVVERVKTLERMVGLLMPLQVNLTAVAGAPCPRCLSTHKVVLLACGTCGVQGTLPVPTPPTMAATR